ncbi:MAG TPA: DUF4349 domain-containing protein [Nocardioidaceae bacterium]|nr:DUF4349 domain-containing protein [Nocardioidaceae bacterium]
MRTTGQRRLRRSMTAGAVTVLIGLAAACSAGSGGASGAGESADVMSQDKAVAPGSASKSLVDRQGGPGDAGGKDPGSGSANRPAIQTRAVIRTGEVALVTKEMNRARTEIDDLLGRHGGYLASEDTTNDRAGKPEHSVLVLRVPEPAFDTVMAELTAIGKTEHADRSSEDVTTEVIDVNTRVATQEASIARLQRFLRQAQNVDDMIRIESEIANRQAALESLKAQQKYLSDQTAMSTITVRLRTPQTPPPPAGKHAGFLAGLENGWSALKALLVGAATVTGALLPFAVTAAILGVPIWLLVRAAARRRQHTAPEASPETS